VTNRLPCSRQAVSFGSGLVLGALRKNFIRPDAVALPGPRIEELRRSFHHSDLLGNSGSNPLI
jgi:hypothetical protein